MKKSKDFRQKKHFHRRARTRCGISVSEQERQLLLAQIQNGALPIFDKQSARVSRHLWEVNGRFYILVYDKMRHNPITVLYVEELPEADRSQAERKIASLHAKARESKALARLSIVLPTEQADSKNEGSSDFVPCRAISLSGEESVLPAEDIVVHDEELRAFQWCGLYLTIGKKQRIIAGIKCAQWPMAMVLPSGLEVWEVPWTKQTLQVCYNPVTGRIFPYSIYQTPAVTAVG